MKEILCEQIYTWYYCGRLQLWTCVCKKFDGITFICGKWYTCHLIWHYIHSMLLFKSATYMMGEIGVRWRRSWQGVRIVLMNCVILCLGNFYLWICGVLFPITLCGMWSHTLSMLELGRLFERIKLLGSLFQSKWGIRECREFVGILSQGMGTQCSLSNRSIVEAL